MAQRENEEGRTVPGYPAPVAEAGASPGVLGGLIPSPPNTVHDIQPPAPVGAPEPRLGENGEKVYDNAYMEQRYPGQYGPRPLDPAAEQASYGSRNFSARGNQPVVAPSHFNLRDSSERDAWKHREREVNMRQAAAMNVIDTREAQEAAAYRQAAQQQRAATEAANEARRLEAYELAQTNELPTKLYNPGATLAQNEAHYLGRPGTVDNPVFTESEWAKREADIRAAADIQGLPRLLGGEVRERLGDVIDNEEKYPSILAQRERFAQGPGQAAPEQVKAIWAEHLEEVDAKIDAAVGPYVDAVMALAVPATGEQDPQRAADIRSATYQRVLADIQRDVDGDILNPRQSPAQYAAGFAVRQGINDGSIEPAVFGPNPNPQDMNMSGDWAVIPNYRSVTENLTNIPSLPDNPGAMDYARYAGRAALGVGDAIVRGYGELGANLPFGLALDTGVGGRVAMVNSADPNRVIMVPRESVRFDSLPRITDARRREAASGNRPFAPEEFTVNDMGRGTAGAALSRRGLVGGSAAPAPAPALPPGSAPVVPPDGSAPPATSDTAPMTREQAAAQQRSEYEASIMAAIAPAAAATAAPQTVAAPEIEARGPDVTQEQLEQYLASQVYDVEGPDFNVGDDEGEDFYDEDPAEEQQRSANRVRTAQQQLLGGGDSRLFEDLARLQRRYMDYGTFAQV